MAAIVQQVTGSPAAATGFTTSAITSSAANVLVLIVARTGGTGTGALTGVSDTAGNTWTVATRGGVSGTGQTRCEVWTTTQDVGALAAGTVSVTSAHSQASAYNVVEISGVDTGSLIDQVSADNSGAAAATSHSTPTVATTHATDLILSVINHPHDASADTFTSSGGAQLTSVVNGTSFRMSAGYYSTTSTGSYDGDWTLPASAAAGLITVAFKSNSSSGLSIKIDWNKDGDYSDTGEDVTSRVLANPGVSLEYGRDQSTALAPMVAGRGGFTLNNASGDYNPLNSGSPIYGYIKPARPVQIQRTVGANTYTLFDGHTDDTPLSPDASSRTVSVSLVDALADFRGQKVTTDMHGGIRTGAAIGYILDDLGWPAADRDIDPGVTVMPWWFESGEDALTAFDKILRSEGPPSLLTMAPGNVITFRDRHHRLLRAESTTSQDTWYGDRDNGTPEMQIPFTYDAGWRTIVNSGGEEINIQTLSEAAVVWSTEGQISLAAGEVKIVNASPESPVQSAITPVSGTDYTVLSGAVAVSLIVSSGPHIPIRLEATGATVISGMRLRAASLTTAYAVQIYAEDSTSITDYGKRDFPSDLPWCNPYDAEAVLQTAVALRAQPLTIVNASFTIPPSDEASADAVLERDLSDRVTLEVDVMDLNADFFIESIEHNFGTELDHTVTFGCEAVSDPDVDALRFDLAGSGFDDGSFATGIDTPATMFILDSSTSGQRFDEGVFCT